MNLDLNMWMWCQIHRPHKLLAVLINLMKLNQWLWRSPYFLQSDGRRTQCCKRLQQILDKTNVFLLTEAAKSLGCNLEDLNISRTSIQRRRQIQRMNFAQSVKYKIHPTISPTVHWDGKIIPDLTSKDKIDRLLVFFSGFEVDKLVAVLQQESGTGLDQAGAAVYAQHE